MHDWMRGARKYSPACADGPGGGIPTLSVGASGRWPALRWFILPRPSSALGGSGQAFVTWDLIRSICAALAGRETRLDGYGLRGRPPRSKRAASQSLQGGREGLGASSRYLRGGHRRMLLSPEERSRSSGSGRGECGAGDLRNSVSVARWRSGGTASHVKISQGSHGPRGCMSCSFGGRFEYGRNSYLGCGFFDLPLAPQ